MKNVLFLLVTVLAADHALAQFAFLSDDRSVSISGYTVALYDSVDASGDILRQWRTNSYSDVQTPMSLYSGFNGSVSDATNISSPNPVMGCFASSLASQNSGMALDQIRLSSSITVNTGGNGGKCLAESLSTFMVSFSVSSPLQTSLSADWSYSTAGNYWVPGNGGCSLTSANNGLIWQSSLLNVDPSKVYGGSRLDTFSTTLEPGDVYTFSVSMETASSYTDNPPTYVNYGVDVTLTPVPEPSTWLLSTMGLVGLVVIRRRSRVAKRFDF